MPTWQKSKPRPNPFGCGVEFHLRTSGNLLAIYNLIGRLTNGGEAPFFSKNAEVARYFYPEATGEDFKSVYDTTCQGLKTLRKMGLLVMLPDRTLQWVHHKDWVKKHPGKCNERQLLPWQVETDPLVSRLYAVAGGKIKIMEHHLAGLRKLASDDEILAEFTKLMKEAKDNAMAKGWNLANISREKVLWHVRTVLKDRARAVGIGTPGR